jgi:predicted ABC-type exoprotein transport system permease subunit
LQNIIDDINRERVRLNKEKQIKGKLKGKVKKKKVIISFFTGLVFSIISGICSPMFSASFISATELLNQFETRGVCES